jgi:diadenosine tetraphosphate (Ap4A) HIT family hydrolase
MPGHLLVIPKRHLEKVSQLNKEEKIEVFDTIIEFQEKILAKFAKGCDIKSNYRPFIPQGRTKVNHLHFHLQPREFEDELYQKSQKFDKELWKDLAEEEIIKLTKLLS